MELKEIAEEIAKFEAKLKPVPPEMLKVEGLPEVPPAVELEAPPIEVTEEICLTKEFLELVDALPTAYIGSGKELTEEMLKSFSICGEVK